MHGRLLLLVGGLLAACSKSEAPSQPAPLESPAPDTPPTPVATVEATAEPAPSATPNAAAAPTVMAAPSPSASASAPKRADAAAPEPSACGTKGLPDCPLQAWMKANANPPVMTGDLTALAQALEKTATFAVPDYANWVSISKDGASAAMRGDLTGAKAACRSCHDQYKQKYKTEHRGRKI